MTKDTCGPSGTGSSRSAALASFLESRLRQKMASNGSILYRLTWKERVTPSGRAICALRASARSSAKQNSVEALSEKLESGNQLKSIPVEKQYGGSLPITLAALSRDNPTSGSGFSLSGWPTTTTRDWKDGGNPDVNVPANALLGRVVWLAGWPTPQTSDGSGGGQAKRALNPDRSNDLNDFALLAGWPTPNAGPQNDTDTKWRERREACKEKHGNNGFGLTLGMAVQDTTPIRYTATGETLTGYSAEMGSSGQLNPAHSRWLMGLPPAWDDCAVTAMRLMPKSRKRSSGR